MSRSVCRLLVAILAFAVLPATSAARVPDRGTSPQATGSATRCAKETRRLTTFQRRMATAKRRYFRTHRGSRARKRFVVAQRRKLAALRRARKRCLARRTPAGKRIAGPSPPVPGTPPAASDPATSSIADLISPDATVSPGEITDGVVRTQLELELTSTATKSQYLAVLGKLRAQVVSSVAGVPRPTVRIPDPGSLDALRAVAADASDEPGMVAAHLTSITEPADLPTNVPPAAISSLTAQLSARAAPAWNARNSAGSPPTLLVADYFGAGPPGAELAATITASDYSTPATPFDPSDSTQSHGYLVTGLAAGAFDPQAGIGAGPDRVAGIWPGAASLPLRIVDLRDTTASSTQDDRIVLRAKSIPGNIVISLSLQDVCPGGCPVAQQDARGAGWITRLNGAGLLTRVLVVSAAGNMQSVAPGDTAAHLGSNYNFAALRHTTSGGGPLTNALVVENAVGSASTATAPAQAICRSDSSKIGGHISAVGRDVFSLLSPTTAFTYPDGGTSSATPQVAGAAATMWAARPTLTPAQVATRLTQTARAVTSPGGDPRCNAQPDVAPVLDAYAALLAADLPSRPPVIGALLDFGNGFNETDLATIDGALQAGGGALDYGTTDFNGDGRTGGPTRDRFDLSHGDPPTWEVVSRPVLGIPLKFDENALTDYDVLCFALQGSLYTGTPAARAAFNEQRCLPPVSLSVSYPANVFAGQPATLTVHAVRSDTGAVLENLPLELTATGGSVAAATGTTDAAGDFATTATRASGATTIDITVTAKVGSTVLDQEAVSGGQAGSAGTVDLGGGNFNDISYAVSAQDFSNGDTSGSKSFQHIGNVFSGGDTATDGVETATVAVDSAAVDLGAAVAVVGNGSGSCSSPVGDPEPGVSDATNSVRQSFTVSGGSVPYTLKVNSASGTNALLRFTLNLGITEIQRLSAPGTVTGTLAPGTYNVQYFGTTSCSGQISDPHPSGNFSWDVDFDAG